MWQVPKMWAGGECWIIGGGPSLAKTFGIPDNVVELVSKGNRQPSELSKYMTAIHDKHVIGVNMAYKLGPWIDMMFFGDQSFYTRYGNERLIPSFPGLKVTCHKWFNNPVYNGRGFKYVERDSRRLGLTDEPGKVVWNGNSGAAAINLAMHTGAKRIILLGFDLNDLSQSTHWHKLYGERNPRTYETHRSCFSHIAEDAKRFGIEIINANPDSAIDAFPKMSLSEILDLSKQNIESTHNTGNKKELKSDPVGVKIGVVIPSCSPERKNFLQNLLNRLKLQTRKPDKLFLLDEPCGKEFDISKRFREGLEKAFINQCDLVLLMEDDDYYPLTYIEEMEKAWIESGKPVLIGADPTTYYHIGRNEWKEFRGKQHASAFCTGISKDADIYVNPDQDPFFDLALWRKNSGALVRLENMPLGIKHGVGKCGGSFHDKGRYEKTDKDLAFLKSKVDEDSFTFYTEKKWKI